MATAHRGKAGHSTVVESIHTSALPTVLALAAVVVGIAALLPLIQSSGATSSAGRLHVLREERAGWQAQLRELEVEAARLGSLERIEQEARKRLGMEEPKEVLFIALDAPAPAPRRVPARYLPPDPGHREAGSSLWQDIFGWLPLP